MDPTGGEITVLLGPNGAGKTTLLHLLAGMKPAQQGSIWLGGKRFIGRINNIKNASAI
ncbi:hypothetical protein HMSSN036_08210 [Paenibacillus macerans]|nr:hypothetical protein HMSSN036_08210 [Paenibacillus macerans]